MYKYSNNLVTDYIPILLLTYLSNWVIVRQIKSLVNSNHITNLIFVTHKFQINV